MGSITGIFEGARNNIRQGKTSIRQSVSNLGGYELSVGNDVFNNEKSVYGKKWDSDFNSFSFDVLTETNIVEDTGRQNTPTNSNVSWVISEPQTGQGLDKAVTSGAGSFNETEPDLTDTGWLNKNPFD